MCHHNEECRSDPSGGTGASWRTQAWAAVLVLAPLLNQMILLVRDLS